MIFNFTTLAQLAIILLLIIIIIKQNRKILFFKKQFMNSDSSVSGSDLFDNINKSKDLYKDLLIELHPDKFVNQPELQEKATQITFELGKQKSTYRNLLNLAKEASKDFQFSEKFTSKYPKIFES